MNELDGPPAEMTQGIQWRQRSSECEGGPNEKHGPAALSKIDGETVAETIIHNPQCHVDERVKVQKEHAY